MRPARRLGGAGPFSFSTWSAATGLAVAILVGSVVCALTRGGFAERLVLVPGSVWVEHAWQQIVTYAFIATDPMSVIFSCFLAWSLGGSLEQAWGSRRLWAFAIGTTSLAALLTVLLSRVPLLAILAVVPFAGAPVLTGALWVAEGWRLGRRPLSFFGIPLNGNQFALIGVGFTALEGVFRGAIFIVPQGLAIALTYLYLRGWSPSLIWLRFTAWRLQRKMRSRGKHLRLVDDGRNMPRDSDRYIH